MVVLQKIYFFNTYLKNDKKTICKEQAGEGEEAVIYQENTHTLHIFFIHSSGNGYLGCFHVSAFVNSAAMKNGVHVSCSILVSSGYMPMSGIAGSYGGFIPSFFKESPYRLP